MDCGDAFMIEDDDETKEHLHVILTKPTAGGEVVTVAICTRRRWLKQSCAWILEIIHLSSMPLLWRIDMQRFANALS
jgi:hypothetical protein